MPTLLGCVLNRNDMVAMNEPAGTKRLFDLTGKRVFIAGHNGMVGSAIVRQLARGGCDVLTVGRDQVDLRRQDKTETVFADLRPHVAIIAAAKVGGIYANDAFPAEFIYDNLAIATNIIHSAFLAKVEKLLFLGLILHLPSTSATTDEGGRPSHRPTRAHQ